MVKTRVYLRVAKTRIGTRVSASTKPTYEPLWNGDKKSFLSKPYPTVLVSLDLDIPDSRFFAAKAEAELKIKNAELATAIELGKDEKEEHTMVVSDE